MKHLPSIYPGLIGKIQGRLQAAKDAETPELRNEALDKATRQVELLGERLARASAERGRKGGLATAERGPEYFKRIAAMRKTRGGGRPKKRPEAKM